MTSSRIQLPDYVIGPRIGPRGQTIFVTRETTRIERAQEDRERALARAQRQEKLGTNFEKAVEEANGLLLLCSMLLSKLARRENDVRNQYHNDQYLNRKRTRGLEKFRAETEEALRATMGGSKNAP